MRFTQQQRRRQNSALQILLEGGAVSQETALHPRYPSGAAVTADTLTRLELQDLVEGGLRDSKGRPRKLRYWLTSKGVEAASALVATARAA